MSAWRKLLRRLKGWILALAVVVLAGGMAAAGDSRGLTGTHIVLLEAGPGRLAGMTSIIVDWALAPAWNVTYVHDLAWEPGRIWRSHDVGITHHFSGAKDLSATLGVRFKIPDEDQRTEKIAYALFAWRWGL